MNLRTILLLSVFFFTACKSQKKHRDDLPRAGFTGSWQLWRVDPPGTGKELQAAKIRAKRLTDAGVMLSFLPDGSCTRISGEGGYRLYKWKFIESGKSVTIYDDSNRAEFSIKQSATSENQFLVLHSKQTLSTEIYTLYSAPAPVITADAFAPVNNTWRFKPAHSETTAEQQQRLGVYMKQLYSLMKLAEDQKQQSSVPFEFADGPLTVYEGGIGTKALNEVPASWIAGYFNEAEARNAYQMLDTYLSHLKYKSKHPDKPGNWIRVDCEILETLISDLDAGKYPMMQTKSGATFSEEGK